MYTCTLQWLIWFTVSNSCVSINIFLLNHTLHNLLLITPVQRNNYTCIYRIFFVKKESIMQKTLFLERYGWEMFLHIQYICGLWGCFWDPCRRHVAEMYFEINLFWNPGGYSPWNPKFFLNSIINVYIYIPQVN